MRSSSATRSNESMEAFGVVLFAIGLVVFAIGFILLTIVMFKFNKAIYRIAKYTLLASGILLLTSFTLCSRYL